MKFFEKNFLRGIAMLSLIAFLSSCQEEDSRTVDITPGNYLAINGSSDAYVGDVASYYLNMNFKESDYVWSIEDGASVSENSENDAYVSVAFSEPADYVLTVQDDDASGSKTVSVVSRRVSFEEDSIAIYEDVANDTLSIPLSIGGGVNGDGTVAYSLTGSLDESRYTVLPGYDSPVSIDSAAVKLVLLPDGEVVEGGETLILTIGSVSSSLEEEYIADTMLQEIKYVIMDDMKVASIDTAAMDITEAGIYSFPVTLTNPAGSDDISVVYSVSLVTGVSDATPTTVPNTLVFEEGETTKEIVLSISDFAIGSDATVTIVLSEVSSMDEEIEINEELDVKELTID
ncbi:MAG: hypothetical protein RIC35_25415 [Marinoscillum sp.]